MQAKDKKKNKVNLLLDSDLTNETITKDGNEYDIYKYQNGLMVINAALKVKCTANILTDNEFEFPVRFIDRRPVISVNTVSKYGTVSKLEAYSTGYSAFTVSILRSVAEDVNVVISAIGKWK